MRESLKENRRDQIYPRPNCQQTGDTNLFQREDALERLPPDSIISGKYRRKEEKTENKSDFISHHGTWGETKKEKRASSLICSPSRASYYCKCIQVIIFLNRLEEDKQHQKAERKENTPKAFACVILFAFCLLDVSNFFFGECRVNNKSLLIYCRVL